MDSQVGFWGALILGLDGTMVLWLFGLPTTDADINTDGSGWTYVVIPDQLGQPVAQKIRTNLLYPRGLLIRNVTLKIIVLI